MNRLILFGIIVCIVFFSTTFNYKTTNTTTEKITDLYREQPFGLKPSKKPLPNLIDYFLPDAAMFWTIPTNANIDDQIFVKIIIDPTKKEIITPAERLLPASFDNAPIISNVLDITLSSSKFKITPITPKTQAIVPNLATIWSWELTPIEPGSHKINIGVIGHIVGRTPNSDPSLFTFRTIDKNIVIIETKQHAIISYIKQYNQWLFTVALVPLIKWCWSLKTALKQSSRKWKKFSIKRNSSNNHV